MTRIHVVRLDYNVLYSQIVLHNILDKAKVRKVFRFEIMNLYRATLTCICSWLVRLLGFSLYSWQIIARLDCETSKN